MKHQDRPRIRSALLPYFFRHKGFITRNVTLSISFIKGSDMSMNKNGRKKLGPILRPSASGYDLFWVGVPRTALQPWDAVRRIIILWDKTCLESLNKIAFDCILHIKTWHWRNTMLLCFAYTYAYCTVTSSKQSQ